MNKRWSLFSVYGIEIEYMIVDRDSLNVSPIADQLIYQAANEYCNEVELGDIAWSNELALHVLEIKTNGPTTQLNDIAQRFHHHILHINELAKPFNAMLMPTGAHPWMKPHQETKLWPHGDQLIYDTYHQIFNCQGHGWANLQSAHLNLPFANEEEFHSLHTAIRLLLPIIPALCASTPIIDGQVTGTNDTRLTFYGNNQQKIPSIAGNLIPEYVTSSQEYQQIILEKMYQDIAPFDQQGILQHEWLNSRAAIARFERHAIEIRILDIQECPLADIACISAIVTVLQALIAQQWSDFAKQSKYSCQKLRTIYDTVVTYGQSAMIHDSDYLHAFGYFKSKSCRAYDLWQHLLAEVSNKISNQTHLRALELILTQGNLSDRIVRLLNKDCSQQRMHTIYRHLAECLHHNQMLEA